MKLISVSIAMLVAAQSTEIRLVSVIPGPADRVAVSDTFAYIAGAETLRVVDVRDASMPVVVGSVPIGNAVTGLAVAGTTVYVTVGLRGIAFVDVSQPASPRVIASLKTPGETFRVVVAGSKAVVGNRMSGAEVVDVSNASRPVSLGSYTSDGYTRDVAVAGNLAFAVDSSNDLAVLDLSKPGPPDATAVMQSASPYLSEPAATRGRWEPRVAVSGSESARRAFVFGGRSVQTYDVSNPAAPRKLAVAKIGTDPLAVALDRSIAFIAAANDGLQMLDLADPQKPVVLSTYPTGGAANDVAISGDLIFVAVGGRGPRSGVVVLRRP